jgi:hypothetical protein
MASTSVKFGAGELPAFKLAAEAAGLSFNAWVRRACRGAAELEAAVRLEGEAEADRVLRPFAELERPQKTGFARREFTPDFGKRLKP